MMRLSDFEINCRVAFHIGLKTVEQAEQGIFNPCNNWSDAGPIIVEHRISIDCIHDQGEKWLAFSGDDCEYRSTHKNPLRAAMIVFLEMQK